MIRSAHALGAVVLCAVLVGCASTPVTAPVTPSLATERFRAAVMAIRQAGTALATELDVQPVRDPEVAELIAQAAQAERAGRIVDADGALERASTLAPADPLLLQLRAELALLTGDAPRAEALAQRAYATGPKVGPLCRRSVETRLQVVLLVPGGTVAAEPLRRQRDACTVAPPPRY